MTASLLAVMDVVSILDLCCWHNCGEYMANAVASEIGEDGRGELVVVKIGRKRYRLLGVQRQQRRLPVAAASEAGDMVSPGALPNNYFMCLMWQ